MSHDLAIARASRLRPITEVAEHAGIPLAALDFHGKAAIYENLRDLQFEYRVGKLSDQDYQRTKTELQTQLAGVLGEIESIEQGAPKPKPALRGLIL